tara:strand:+ start:4585 stop:4935 length:351 start_codon:yes stop_codon:yes gene_type:complete
VADGTHNANHTNKKLKTDMNLTQDQIKLQAHIEAQNAKSAAWVAVDPANRFAGMVVSDPIHWAKNYNVKSVAEYEFEMALSTYSDCYKDCHGFRPRMNFTTLEEIERAQKALRSWA